jgi:hypothetical protein
VTYTYYPAVKVESTENVPQGLKPVSSYQRFAARLKPCPFKASLSPQTAIPPTRSEVILAIADLVTFSPKQGSFYRGVSGPRCLTLMLSIFACLASQVQRYEAHDHRGSLSDQIRNQR